MENKITGVLYIPRISIELFRGNVERLIVLLTGTNKVEFACDLVDNTILFYTTCYGDSVEEAKETYENFKELIVKSFGVEPKEKVEE